MSETIRNILLVLNGKRFFNKKYKPEVKISIKVIGKKIKVNTVKSESSFKPSSYASLFPYTGILPSFKEAEYNNKQIESIFISGKQSPMI